MTGTNLVLVVTGASTSAHIPYWINWIAVSRPHVRVRILRTVGAARFLTTASLASPAVEQVLDDSWDAAGDHPIHVDLTMWADGLLVYPASQSYLSDLAHDRADRPSLLVAQLLGRPVVVAPGLPPRGIESGAVARAWRTIERNGTARIVPPVPGGSKYDSALTSWAPGDFAAALDAALAPYEPPRPADRPDAATRLRGWFDGSSDGPLMVSSRRQFDALTGGHGTEIADIVLGLSRSGTSEVLEAAAVESAAADGIEDLLERMETLAGRLSTSSDSTVPARDLAVAGEVLVEHDLLVDDGWSTPRFLALCERLYRLLAPDPAQATDPRTP